MSSMQARTKSESGYTLVELMVVVAIIGILAVIALPAYNSYMKKSKTTEAIGFLAEIKARQESYRADFGQYCNASGGSGPSQWNPPGPPGENYRDWQPDLFDWDELGAAPVGGKVLFAYETVAGAPSQLPSSEGFSNDRGYTGTDFWFISSAIGDLDADGTQITFESYSASASLYVSESAGWE
jgi:prepilin-type N-terminal cleavage/methylation domain-containing protein